MGRTRTRANGAASEVSDQSAATDAGTAVTKRRRRATPSRGKKTAKPQAAAESHSVLPAAEKPRTWKDDLADVQKAGFWLWLCLLWLPSLTLSTLSGNDVGGIALRAIQSGNISAAETAAVWNVFVLTAPFTTAVALVGIALLRGWFDGDSGFGVVYFGCFVLIMPRLEQMGEAAVGAAAQKSE